jgi:4-carboxymuconolactone decarboxylase
MAPRIAPVPPTGNRPDIQELLDLSTEAMGGVLNVFLTLAKNPEVLRLFIPSAGPFTAGKLPPVQRELLILRTAWLCRCDYEWGQHVRIGGAAGLTEGDITRVADELDPQAWSPLDYALLRATDELVENHRVKRPTWDALAEHFDEAALIELVMVVGNYVALAGVLNSAEVEREPGVPGFPSPAVR